MKFFVSAGQTIPVLLLFCYGASSQTSLKSNGAHENTSDDLDGTGLSEALAQCLAQTGQVAQLASQLTNLQTELSAQTSALASQLSEQGVELTEFGSALISGLIDIMENLPGGQLSTAGLTALRSQLRQAAATPPRDCSDLPAGTTSGVHTLYPGRDGPVAALCDMDLDGGNWTVFQRRDDIQPRQDFYLGWLDYKWGFGELDGEFWWGLERLWGLTSQLDRRYELRIDLTDFNGDKRHAVYQGFRIAPEADNYRLTAVNYTGDAGDSLALNNGRPFATKDKEDNMG
ncbi:microfibril-associated glycoprotein 4-like [Amphibalanus amphitrite]|uniref:microfibril-associated glycoprotein 4-like n=1 Tax=Amphibalanus amphitrite TaxID=1232801 RepID=UPI001C922B85|nr:microfibril-associated glycoprotein 4-like [Amphibalanus amphitrite]